MPRRTFHFVRYGRLAVGLSGLLLAVSLASFVINGFNLGIDFAGGTLLERRFAQPVTAQQVREALASEMTGDVDLGGLVIQPLDDPMEVLIRTRPLDREELQAVDQRLAAAFGDVEAVRTELVGPVVGAELVRRALWAVVLAAVGVLGYVWFRFELKFAVSAIAAVMHDAVVAVGVVSLLGIEVNSPLIAAVLTVVGYSINNTIVIFDRVRENLRTRKNEDLAALVNRSLNETLARTINTSLTTLLVIMTLLVFGGVTLRDFVLVLLVGVVVGTYSSIFLASSLWLRWKEREERLRASAGIVPGR
ncbi:MAG: protein translocase subunit SecF [Firmicutes bacterium]|nr:protein translocase subunit SecF [Bacillota bacterium]